MNHGVIAVALAVVLTGCSLPAKTVQELRDGARVAVVEVERPYAEVVKVLADRANACLHKVVVDNGIVRGYHYRKEYKYTPSVMVGKDKTELHLQRSIDGTNMIGVVEAPPGGFFFLIAEVTPVERSTPDERNKTRVEIYLSRSAEKVLVPAIKSWAGGGYGCPDLTKI